MAEPIRRGTLVDALVDRVRADVLTGRYPAGSLLPPERELAATYQVTRTTLKHALIRLAEAGLVQTKHGVGTRVCDIVESASVQLLPVIAALAGPEWLGEIFEARREIGALMAARAATRASRQDQARLEELLASVRDAAGTDDAQLAECEVFQLLATVSGNRVIELMVRSVLRTYLQNRHRFAAPFADPVVAADRLAPVVEAVCAGEPVQARRVTEAYLHETELLMRGGAVWRT